MSSRKPNTDVASSSRANRPSAATANTSKEDGTSDAGANDAGADDQLFEPSLDMMVNDFDDESTLEMEEQMASSEAQDPNAELNSLQKEGDMPIEELLALYNCVPPTARTSPSASRKRSSRTSRNAAALDKTLMPPPDPPRSVDDSEPAAKKIKAESDSAADTEIKPDETRVADSVAEPKSASAAPADATDPPASASNQAFHGQRINSPTQSRPNNSGSNAETSPADASGPTDATAAAAASESGVKVKTEAADDSEKVCDDNKDGTEAKKDDKVDLKGETSVKNEPDEDEADDAAEEGEDNDDDDDEESDLKKLYPETFKTKERRLLRANSHPNSDDEEEDDNDYSPVDDDFKKKIMVGSEYQAQIPEGLCQYDDALPYENEDKLVWDPSQLDDCDIEVYLQRAMIPALVGSPAGSPSSSLTASPSSQCSMTSFKNLALLPCGSHLRDDEQSLYLLLQCGHNTDEALRRRRLNATVVAAAVANQPDHSPNGDSNRMSLWSEEECRNFESGLRVYGKDFHAIQLSKVRTRSVSELVQFYYLWKKTERHDIFANKTRLEKKKYNLHPGLTDYMDRFLEEQENNGGISLNSTSSSAMHGNSNGAEHLHRDRSLSPVLNCLLYADNKRHRMHDAN